MTTYSIEVGGTEYPAEQIITTEIQPNADPDVWSAILSFRHDFNGGETVVIKRDGTVVFQGLLELRRVKFGGGAGVRTHIGGRQEKVRLWRKWAERNEDPKSGGFWKDYLPHRIFQFYLYPSKSDVSRFHRSGWGIDPADDWVVSTNPAGSNPHRVKDRLITLEWKSGVNQASGHYVCVDLGSAKNICAIRVECRAHDTDYARNYKIQYSNTSCASGFTDLVTVTNNTANNIVHAWSSVSARYWRIYLTASASFWWRVSEIYLYETDGTITGISEGTLDSHAVLDEALDFPPSRRTDNLQKITDITETALVPWEWWVDHNGAVYYQARRGSDKSATISFEYGNSIEEDEYAQDNRPRVDRVKVLGSSKGNDQDLFHSSAWVGSGEYEKIFFHKELESADACTAKANIYENQLGGSLVKIKCTVFDEYPTNSWGIGDDITLTDATTGLSGAVRVKKIIRKWDGKAEVVMIEASNYRETVVDNIKKMQRDINYLQTMMDRSKSVMWDEVDENFAVELGLNRPKFIDDGNYFKTDLWTVGGTNPVTPYTANVNNYPALTIETAGANGDSTRIVTSNSWSGEKWVWASKLKFAEITNNVVTFGLKVALGGDEITFEWDAAGGTFSAICTQAKVSTSVALSNYPDLTNWHLYRIEWNSSSEVKFYIDGKLYATIITNIPITLLPYQFMVHANAASVKTIYVRGIGGQAQIDEE